jgi:hypothetical protein
MLQLRPDADLLPEYPGEHPARSRPFETGKPATRVGAAAGFFATCHEEAVAGGEPDQLALRRPPAAAGATPQRNGSYNSSSGCSTGMPAGTSSGSATSAAGATGSSAASTSSASVSAGGPAT